MTWCPSGVVADLVLGADTAPLPIVLVIDGKIGRATDASKR